MLKTDKGSPIKYLVLGSIQARELADCCSFFASYNEKAPFYNWQFERGGSDVMAI